MAGHRRAWAAIVLALAAACSKGGSGGGNAGSSGSGAKSSGELKSADGVVASVKDRQVQVKTRDGRVLQFPMKEDTKVTLGGGEASSAVVTEGAPVRVAFKGDEQKPDVVSIDVEPKVRGQSGNAGSVGSAPGQPPAPGRYDAQGGNVGDAQGRPPPPSDKSR